MQSHRDVTNRTPRAAFRSEHAHGPQFSAPPGTEHRYCGALFASSVFVCLFVWFWFSVLVFLFACLFVRLFLVIFAYLQEVEGGGRGG